MPSEPRSKPASSADGATPPGCHDCASASFALERADENSDLPGRGQRWRVTTTLAGRIFERAVIDVAFAAAPVHLPEQIATSNLLDFAGVDAVSVPTLGIEQRLAEKLHAYTREYAGGRRSSRVKDLVDVVLIANTSAIDAAQLAEAITVIFDRRAEQAVPSGSRRRQMNGRRPGDASRATSPLRTRSPTAT